MPTNNYKAVADKRLIQACEKLAKYEDALSTNRLLRPDGTPVPELYTKFKVGETVVVKNSTYKVAYLNEHTLILEPVRPEDALTKD